jgi:surface antigen
MLKTNLHFHPKFFHVTRSGLKRGFLLGVLSAFVALGGVPRLAQAVTCATVSSCQQQINNLSNQNASAQQSLSGLESSEASYQDAVNQLQSQINTLQSQLATNQANQASLQQQITANEQEIAAKKSTLADDITTMYVAGQMTTIEELATSKNLSDYVDKQEYQTVVQNQLTAILQQIDALEQTLQSQKIAVDNLVSTEQAQNTQLADEESQQQSLLNYNQSQQAAYNQQISSTNSNISQLKATLTALNNVSGSTQISGGTCGGGYPQSTPSSTAPGTYWGCNQPQDNTTDNWNMDNRECVSYTAYMVSSLYGVSTKNWGNAYQWTSSAAAAGYTVSSTPAAGDIAIRGRDYSVAGDVGHAMYVEAVNGDGTITVEEYNEHYNGTFDERVFDPSSYADRGGMLYIDFQ